MVLLISLLVVTLSLVLLALVGLRVWRAVTSLGRTVSDAGARIAAASAGLEALASRDDDAD